jgi:uncharacterized membrane protein YdbT with pleckstrin-like domain
MANESKTTPATRAHHEFPWRFWRRRLTLLQFWRGRDKRWYFFGQQSDEQVRLLVRRHWWFLVQPALPFAVAITVLIILLWTAAAVPAWAPLWYLLELAAFLVMLGTGCWFAYRDLISWWYETYIITNKRIIYSRGLLEPTRLQTPIEKVQQVGLDINRLLGLVLGFGTLHVFLTGGEFYIKDVPNPRQVRDALIGAWEDFKASKPKEPPIPIPQDAEISGLLEKLAEPKPVPALPDADANRPPVFGSDPFIGPRRTFGGFLRIPCNVRYLSGEHTVKYVQRSIYVLWRNLAVPILLLVIVLPLAVAGPGIGLVSQNLQSSWWFGMGMIVVAILIAMALTYLNYVDDVYILTNKRIIDIERYYIFFFEKHDETEYKNIRDVKVKVQNILQRFLDIGNVYIETPGNNPDIIMSNVDQPFLLQDEILGIRAHKEKEDAAKKENTDKKSFYRWFSTVVAKLEDMTTSRGTPDLKNMDLLSAMTHAQEFGLDVVVRGEAIDHSGVPSGHVVYQDPPAGTLMQKDSQIEVVLSKRAVPVGGLIP